MIKGILNRQFICAVLLFIYSTILFLIAIRCHFRVSLNSWEFIMLIIRCQYSLWLSCHRYDNIIRQYHTGRLVISICFLRNVNSYEKLLWWWRRKTSNHPHHNDCGSFSLNISNFRLIIINLAARCYRLSKHSGINVCVCVWL